MNSFPGFKEIEHGFCCFWTINNFSSYKKKLPLESSTFTINAISESQWFLDFGKSQHDEDYLYLFINKVFTKAYIQYKYSFWLLTNNGWNPMIQHDTATFKTNGSSYGMYKFIKWPVSIDDTSEFLVNDSLTIACHIYNKQTKSNLYQVFLVSEVVSKNNLKHRLKTDDYVDYYSTINVPITLLSKRTEDVKSACTQTEPAGKTTNEFEDINDFLSHIKENNFSFVSIRTADKHFVVLKALLCARSPVFNAMFNNNMIENGQNAVDIHDVDCDTISLFIQFLHLQPLGNLKWDEIVKLFYVADKYQVEMLKKQCISLLKKSLSEDNVCDCFILANRHGDLDLKQASMEFFQINSKIILRSDNWKEFMLNHISLAAEILADFVTKL